jgi:hypothetical protein
VKRRSTITAFALLLAIAHCAPGQVQVGQLNMNLSGQVTGGYTADYGSSGSDHGFAAGGAATLSGSFYNPNFLNFSVLPFYNQSWANSDSQSLISSSGVTAATGIFSGSDYPGSINYTKVLNSTGNFGIPGVANYTSHGDSDALSIGWSEHVENLPMITVGYTEGTGDYSIYGASSNISNHFEGINATINYLVAGFTLTGGYHYLDTHVDLPEILGAPAESSTSRSNSYSFGVTHKLPFNGSFSGSVSRSDVSSEYTGGNYNGTLDYISAGVAFQPIQYLNIGAQAQYNDNLLGSIYAPILAAGGVLPTSLPDQSSHSLDIIGYGNYSIPAWHLIISGTDDHRDETLLGSALTSDVFTGTVTYSNSLWGGFINATGGANHSTINPGDESRIGFLGSVNYSRRVHLWEATVSGNYVQNAQTLLITYTTNSYGYSGSLSRKFNRRTYWVLTGSGTKTTLLGQDGSGTFSQSYSSSLVLRKFTATGGFSQSSGNGILTPAGIAAVTVLLPVVSPTSMILYGGTSYSASVSAAPFHGLQLSASYAHSISNTQSDSVSSNNRMEQFNARIQYLVRKMYFQAGYLYLTQGFSQSGVPPVTIGSIYVGLSRWFNFF